MYHSITFGTKNTWDDWHLVPSSRPLFNPPSQKVKTLDIPGGDGLIDLSESLTGYPVYNNRQGSIEFIVMNGYKPWYEVYSEIMEYLHGKKMNAVLEDEPDYYYEGTFSVNAWKSEQRWSKIVINYSVAPYKRYFLNSVENWIWDRFSFQNGIIRSALFRDLSITNVEVEHRFRAEEYGPAPVCPTFHVSFPELNEIVDGTPSINVKFINQTMNIEASATLYEGITQIPDFIFYGEEVSLFMKSNIGVSVVSIDFRQGRL